MPILRASSITTPTYLLVGDSLGMVLYAMDSTLGVSLDLMIAHGRAVVRGSKRAMVVVDMPFGSYEESPADGISQRCPRHAGNRLRRSQA